MSSEEKTDAVTVLGRPDVAVVCEYSTLNGGEQSLLALLDDEIFCSSSGPRVIIIAPPEGRLADALRSQPFVHVPFQVMDERGQRLPREQIQRQLIKTLNRISPQLVHANSLSMGRLLGSVRNEITSPCTSHLRDIVGLSRAAVEDLNRLDQMIAVSSATREFHIAQGVDEQKVDVIYNGIDSGRFSPSARTGFLLREFHLPADALLIATIGQIGLRKGQDVLAAAATHIGDRFSHVHFLLIGERNSTKEENRQFERQLHETFDAAGLTQRAHFLGYRADMSELLREIDILVHPARQEPLGRVLLEAAAAGLPIIATNVGGTPEIFGTDEAVLINPDDINGLATQLTKLLTDATGRQQLGAAARRRVVEAFTSSHSARQTWNLWKRYL